MCVVCDYLQLPDHSQYESEMEKVQEILQKHFPLFEHFATMNLPHTMNPFMPPGLHMSYEIGMMAWAFYIGRMTMEEDERLDNVGNLDFLDTLDLKDDEE